MSFLQRIFGQRNERGESNVTTETTDTESDGVAANEDRRVSALIEIVGHLAAAGRYAQALSEIGSAAAEIANHPRVSMARAETLMRWGRHREARAELCAIEGHGHQDIAMMRNLAFMNAALGRSSDAVRWLEQVQTREPDSWRAHFELSVALRADGRIDDAMAHCVRSLKLQPERPESMFHLGALHLQLNEYPRAEAIFRRLVEQDPMNAAAWKNLGVCLYRMDRAEEALAAGTRAAAIASERGQALEMFAELATYQRECGNPRAAVDTLERNLARCPDPSGHYLYGQLLLKVGRLPEGWVQHEFRWLDAQYLPDRAYTNRPTWSGQDLDGKTLLLVPDQGFGDFFQHIRYAPSLKALGATVWLRSPPDLEAIARCCAGIDRIIDARGPMPDFDFHISLVSLPFAFATEIASIPADIPYINADPDLVDAWSRRLHGGGRLRVGLAWAGSAAHAHDRLRSLPLSCFAPLWEIDGVTFCSLQKSAAAAELRDFAARRNLADLAPDLHDFADAAAAIQNLDLVITVDTSIAHLAGAMGKAVWILLHEPSEYRWLTEREDSPWYPTARLFRQKRRGDWEEVIERVGDALREWVAGGGKAAVLPQRAPVGVVQPRGGRAPRRVAGLSAVTEARVGIVQYFPEDEPMGSSLEWYGEWLQGQLELMLRWVRAGGVGMEVGAGVGAHAIALGEALGPEGHLFLYEGKPVVKRVLSQNLGANRIGNVTLMRRMLSGPQGGEGTETLDELQLTRLDWLKVNAPVRAQELLAGGEQTLWRLRPVLLLGEAEEAELPGLAERVKGCGYRCWRIETPLYDPANFNRRDEDIFGGKRALALLAIPEEMDAGAMPSGLREA